MNILAVNTGDEKLDVAYKNFQVHVSSFDKFVEFQSYFNKIVKTDDKERLNKWLLKVLFIEFRYGRAQDKHDFDILLEKVSSEKKEQLKKWLKDNLEKVSDGNV
jgi:7,8-dihydro-6-hydroxymethylpterin-pyrophosphokinase